MASTLAMSLGNSSRKRQPVPIRMAIALAMLFALLFGGAGASLIGASGASASTASVVKMANDTAAAEKQLQKAVTKAMAGKDYSLKGGGTIKGSALFSAPSTSGTYTIKEGEFASLSNEGQNQFVADLVVENKKAYDPLNSTRPATTPLVTQATSENWLRELQATPGVGSKLLNEVLVGTAPDFVSGGKIFAPFQGPLGTAMGFLAILMMSLFALVIVLDLCYIVLPMFRIVVEKAGGGEGKSEGGGGVGSFIVTNEAISAVRDAEGNSEGGARSALGTYFKRRAISMFILGLMLLYLVSGRIWSIVGTLMDLSAGIL